MATSSNPLGEELDQSFLEQGRRLDAARKAYPHAPRPWIDLSTGISPWGYPLPSVELDAWRRLPELRDLNGLLELARAVYRVPAEAEIIALPGCEAAICILPWLVRQLTRVAVVGLTYGSHVRAWTGAGHHVREVSDLKEASRASIAVVVNPNNPDGRIFSPIELLKAANALVDDDSLLIVDEAFVDVVPEQSVLHPVINLDRVLVLRSFGKFYGAAGVRLGFAISSHPIMAKLKAALGAWPVSAGAIVFGAAALRDVKWAEMHRANLTQAAQHLDAMLVDKGLKIFGGTSLFRYVEPRMGVNLFEQLAGQGILIRPYEGCRAVRIGLPNDAAELERLRAAI